MWILYIVDDINLMYCNHYSVMYMTGQCHESSNQVDISNHVVVQYGVDGQHSILCSDNAALRTCG